MSSTPAGMAHATFRWPVPTRDGAALAAGLALPFLVTLVLVPFRTDLSHTNAALVLVVVVVAVAAGGITVGRRTWDLERPTRATSPASTPPPTWSGPSSPPTPSSTTCAAN
ncbi:hypothetical protein ACWGJB_30160 [Streptomyces sp. NPDC054813]